MRRRDFLALTGATLPLLFFRGARAADAARSPRVLVVFLRGGYDALNVVVPHASDDYLAARPTIAVARDAPGLLRLDADWSLAPALAAPLGDLWRAKQLAFVPFAGTDDLSRSHFETQDRIELGQPLDHPDTRSGFLARLALTLHGPRAIAFTDNLPVCCRGVEDIPNVSLKSVGKPAFDARQAQILAGLYAHQPLQAQVREGLELRQQVSAAMAEEMNQANRDAISARGFELEAQRIARLLRQDYSLGFVDVGGWDTHVGETQTLAGNLDSVGRGLATLARDLGPVWDDTVVIVVSEFGRTFRENGTRGTDHGHGTTYWVAGGGVKGGRIVGQQQSVRVATLFQDRDLPVLNDYRALLGGLFTRLWDLPPARLDAVFPGLSPSAGADLGLI